MVRGKAWSGTGPVTNVDISLTGESEWLPGAPRDAQRPIPMAELVVRMGTHGAGRKSLRARATDAAGNVQPEVPIWNRLGYGNNAIEVIYVDVR